MADVETLPSGYMWIDEAFEHAWRNLEDADDLESKLLRVPHPSFSEAMKDGAWTQTDPRAQKAYDDSRRRTESVMRAALADGRLRAFISHQVTGEPRELSDRHKWATLSFGLANFDRQTHHSTCPGPDSGGAHVYVLLRELKMLERAAHGREPTNPKLATVPAKEAHWKAFSAQLETWPTMEKAEQWRKLNIPHVTRDSWREMLRIKGFDTKRGPKGPRRPATE
jgi:hypothetical protein